MADFPVFLQVLIVGALVGTVLLCVAVVKTVRYHGWGKQTWAPPAVPWFLGGIGVMVVALGYAVIAASV